MTRSSQSVFVIRLWWERAPEGARRRGYVEHVASRQRFYFSDIGDALDFVAALGIAPPAGAELGCDADGRTAPDSTRS